MRHRQSPDRQRRDLGDALPAPPPETTIWVFFLLIFLKLCTSCNFDQRLFDDVEAFF
jgi:hypothetical protein